MANTALHESFDHGAGALSNSWNVDTSVAGQVTLRGNSGLMERGGSTASGHGYGTYTVHAKFEGTQPGPAIVFWPGDDKWPGQEMDMGEFAHDGSGRQYGIVHWNENGHDAYEYAVFEGVQTGVFHDYTMVWEPGQLTFKVDGRTVGTLDNHIPVDFDHGGMNNTIGMLNNNSSTSMTVTEVNFTPLGGASSSTSTSSSTQQEEAIVVAEVATTKAASVTTAEASTSTATSSEWVDWDAIAAQVMANYEATGQWFF